MPSSVRTKSSVMEFHIDSESLIFAVRDRPYLYDYGAPDYTNKAKKIAGWLEICDEILPNWGDLNADEKECCELELQKKWRNLRDSFTKEYKKQILASVEGRPPPRPYLYYNALSFLDPIVKRRHSKIVESIKQAKSHSMVNKIEPKEEWSTEAEYLNEDTEENLPSFHEVLLENSIGDDSSKDADNSKRSTITQNNQNLKRKKISKSSNCPSTSKKRKLTDSICSLTLAIKDQVTNENKDSDEMFLLSLKPYFKRFNPNQKLDAQIQIMAIVKQKMEDHEFE